MTDETVAFRAKREQMLLRLLVRLFRRMSDETVLRMRKRGIAGMMPAYPRLLGNLDTGGTRIGALARKMGTTRQAVAQLAAEIERAGFVERVPDPEDGRGVIVRFTKKGRAGLACAIEVMIEIEAEYATIIDAKGLSELKRLMAAILDVTDQEGRFGLN
ncbi:MAG: MarR family transcriptional regulator [Rhizobiales bacterium]|nr:MarR family transcriptional regulator [Hyphomicrobiales bacterium]